MSYVGVFKGTAYSLSISFEYLLLLISVGLKNMRKVLSSCHIINQRSGCGFSIFNKSTRTSVGIPALAELVVGTVWWARKLLGWRHSENPSSKPIREVGA